MKTNKFNLFFVNLFDLLIGKIISVKIAESEKKIGEAMKLQMQDYQKLIDPLSNAVSDIEKGLTPEKIKEVSDPSLVTSPDGRFKIRVEKHPNRDRASFHTSMPLISDGPSLTLFDFPDTKGENHEVTDEMRKIVESIFKTNACTSLSLQGFEIGIGKSPALKWNDISPMVIEILFKHLNQKYSALAPEQAKERNL